MFRAQKDQKSIYICSSDGKGVFVLEITVPIPMKPGPDEIASQEAGANTRALLSQANACINSYEHSLFYLIMSCI